MSDEHQHDPAPDSEALPGPLAEIVVAVEELRKERKRKKKKEARQKKAKEAKQEKQEKPISLGSSRGIETMFRTSYRVNMDLSALADTKSNIMISINGIIISILLASISPKIDSNNFLFWPTTVLLVGCLISMVYAVLAARPRINSRIISLEDVRANRANILFFGNFVHLTSDEYLQGMTELLQNTDTLYQNMIRDIYGLGSVLQKKFKLLRVSYTVFMIALIVGVALFIYAFVGEMARPAIP